MAYPINRVFGNRGCGIQEGLKRSPPHYLQVATQYEIECGDHKRQKGMINLIERTRT